MPIYATFEPEFPLAEGKKRIGVPALLSIEDGIDIKDVRKLAYNALDRFAEGMGSKTSRHEETFECNDTSCGGEIEHPHRIFWAFMDVDKYRICLEYEPDTEDSVIHTAKQ